MDEVNSKPPSTSILELLYLIRAKNKGELSFVEWHERALGWAKAVIAEHERGGRIATPLSSTPSAQESGGDEYRHCQ
jgi:hypothetical protein